MTRRLRTGILTAELPHPRSYTIAFTIRSGSNLLCDVLARNGLGYPTEYFQAPLGIANARLYDTLGVPRRDFKTFIERLVTLRSQNGVFGSKVAWDHKNALLAALADACDPSIRDLQDYFPNHCWIYLRRRDRIAQAVSAWTAQETGVWSDANGTGGGSARPAPDYDFFAIFTVFFSLLVEDYLWGVYFAGMPQPPLALWYEDIVEAPAATLTQVVGGLHERWGMEPPDPETLVIQTRFKKQASERSAVFAERFAEDLGRIGVSEHWQSRQRELGAWLEFFQGRGWKQESPALAR